MAGKTLDDVIDRLKQEGTLLRNTGKHSVRSVKELLREDELSKKEDRRENIARQEKQLELLGNLSSGVDSVTDPKGAATSGGLLGALGLGALGLGAGAAGLGVLLAGGGYLLDKITDINGEEIKKNVVALLSIREELGEDSKLAFVGEGAAFLGVMAGVGAGLAIFSVGATAASLSQATINRFLDDKWAETTVKNVKTLLGLKDEVAAGSNANLLYKGASFGLAMTGIGIGLAVFGAGSAVAGMSDALLKNFGNAGWAFNIVYNVKQLLSLKDEVGDGSNVKLLANGAAFTAAMTGIGIGLSVFGVGSAVAGAADKLVGKDYAKNIKDSVVTLLSIKDELGDNWEMLKDSAAFPLAMTGIAAGLVAFSIGAATSASATAYADTLTKFSSGEDFAQTVKDRVTTLLSIADIKNLGADVSKFALTMGGISAGLVAFSVGTAATGVSEGLASAISKFSEGEDWATTVKNRVTTLLGIMGDPNNSREKADDFKYAMGKVSSGLGEFALASFSTGLANAAKAILDFFSGGNSAFDQIRQIADDAEDLEKAGTALEKIAAAMKNFGEVATVRIQNIDFEKFAQNLAGSIQTLRALSTGGRLNDGWFDGADIDLGPVRAPGQGGLLDPELNLDQLVAKIAQVNYVLGRTLEVPTGTALEGVSSDNMGLRVGANYGPPSVTIAAPQTNVNQTNNSQVINQGRGARRNRRAAIGTE